MARDLKLAVSWGAVGTVVPAASTLGTAITTPTGDKVGSQNVVTLRVTSGTAAPVVSSTLNLGYRNTQMDTSSFSNWIAGSEVTSIANDPALWGNTSTAEMYLRGVFAWSFGATAALQSTLNPQVQIQAAADNGSGSPNTNTWSPVGGIYQLVDFLTPTITAMTTAGVATTSAPHGLQNGDYIAMSGTIGFTANIAADVVYRVSAVTSTGFTIQTATGSAITTATGTFTGPMTIAKLRGANAFGSTGAIMSIPLIETVRPHLRVALVYPTTSTGSTVTLTLSKFGLVTGRENAPRD